MSGRDPIDVLREALSHLGPFRGGAADEALAVLERQRTQALAMLNGIDYEEDSRIDRAVRILEGESL